MSTQPSAQKSLLSVWKERSSTTPRDWAPGLITSPTREESSIFSAQYVPASLTKRKPMPTVTKKAATERASAHHCRRTMNTSQKNAGTSLMPAAIPVAIPISLRHRLAGDRSTSAATNAMSSRLIWPKKKPSRIGTSAKLAIPSRVANPTVAPFTR